MTRLYSLFLLAIYCTATMGFTIRQHYCMGEMVDTSFFVTSGKQCTGCGMERSEENKDCCKDICTFYKTAAKHTQSQLAVLAPNLISFDLPLGFSCTVIPVQCPPVTERIRCLKHPQPPIIYLRNRNFRI